MISRAGVAVAGRKRRVFASTAWWKHIQSASDDELWNLLQNLREARLHHPESLPPKPYNQNRGSAWRHGFMHSFIHRQSRTDRRDI